MWSVDLECRGVETREVACSVEPRAALGSLFILIGTIVGAYFGIKVSSDTSERSQGVIERAHGSAMEATEKAQKTHDTAQQALAELEPAVAGRIVERR